MNIRNLVLVFALFISTICYGYNIEQIETVKAKDTDYYSITLSDNEKINISVTGNGKTDLDLYVYDSNGNIVSEDSACTDKCNIIFTSKGIHRYTIKVINRGNENNTYKLIIQ